MSGVTAHVLDTARGCPAAGLSIALAIADEDGFSTLSVHTTNADGRVPDLTAGTPLQAGTYRLTFGTGAYFEALGQAAFFPEVTVLFVVDDPGQHYHVPLLLSPFSYSTYRGS